MSRAETIDCMPNRLVAEFLKCFPIPTFEALGTNARRECRRLLRIRVVPPSSSTIEQHPIAEIRDMLCRICVRSRLLTKLACECLCR
jgi:hypothetical protein